MGLFRPLHFLLVGDLVGEIDLALTDRLHHLALGFLIFGVVGRRAVIGLAEPGQR